MKKIIPILILLLITVEGFSKCASSGLTCWPAKETINANSIFVIGGYATSQKIITGLGTTYKVYLKSGKQIVNLKIQETLVGQFSLTQAILKPEKNLTVGLEYELIIEGSTRAKNEITRYSDLSHQNETIKWKVIADQDTNAPVWKEKPKFKNDTYEMFGCGPAVYANFSFSASDSSEYLIKTTVKNLTNGKETTYYLNAEDNIIEIGHGMCSGAFNFDNGDKFEVEFDLIDASGNQTAWTGKRLEFKKPV